MSHLSSGVLPLWLLPLAPVFAALVCGVLAITGRGRSIAPALTVAATILSGAITAASFPGKIPVVASYPWLSIGHNLNIVLSVQLDPLAWTMVAVVCTVSLLVQIYSIGYMHSDPGYTRYFAYLALFTSSMLGLVVADNLFQLYVCWELVGICSYLLIGFWWAKRSAADAAKKAFIVTRFGDAGFFLGVLLLVTAAGSFRFDAVQHAVAAASHGQAVGLSMLSPQMFIIVAPLLLFCGAIGKSAQFPLHIWLPDAMEGPTPVSALIHAATMVAAGVYMVARLLPVFAASPFVMSTIIVIGSITALVGATIALVQTDIKKVLAYSTISQLGYMFIALGAGSREAGMFHLVTHAAFKALLFLTAGSVIHALHRAGAPNDLRTMGGLGKRMPLTAITCGIGILALAGLPGLSGFWSKDAVLSSVLASGNAAARFGLAVALIVAALTAFYACRLWLLAFAGKPRSEAAAEAHESPASMTAPLAVLALFSLALGWWLHSRFSDFLNGGLSNAHESAPLWLPITAGICSLGGIAAAWFVYASPTKVSDPIERIPGYALFANLWYLDAFWSLVAARGALACGRAVAWFDRNVVDGAMNGVGSACQWAGRQIRRTATGQAQLYTSVVMAGLVVLALTLAFMQTGGR